MKQTARIDVADVLRGISVLAIVLLHSIEHFNFYSFPPVTSQWLKFTDTIIWDSLFFTFGGKAYAIFALLFGLSFYIQDSNQQKKGKDFRLRFMWRLVLLFVIGHVNALFFTGEILVMYSLIGFVLVPVARLPNKVVFCIAIVLLLQPMELVKLVSALSDPNYVLPASKVGEYFGAAAEVQTNGTFLETATMNLTTGQMANFAYAWEYGRIFQTAGLFMLGMLLGRSKLLLYTDQNKLIWIKTLLIALACFFALDGLRRLLPDFIENEVALKPLTTIIKSLANFSFMLVLVTSITWVFYATKAQTTLIKIAPYGRMSLTNYITQSIIGSFLFYNWGLGLYAYLGITHSFLVGLALFVVQYTFCVWWLNRHQQGPLEYLWKKGTWIKF